MPRIAKVGAEIGTPTCVAAIEPAGLFEAEMRTLAYHDHVFAALANRCGTEEDHACAGASPITGPDGAGRVSALSPPRDPAGVCFGSSPLMNTRPGPRTTVAACLSVRKRIAS